MWRISEIGNPYHLGLEHSYLAATALILLAKFVRPRQSLFAPVESKDRLKPKVLRPWFHRNPCGHSALSTHLDSQFDNRLALGFSSNSLEDSSSNPLSIRKLDDRQSRAI